MVSNKKIEDLNKLIETLRKKNDNKQCADCNERGTTYVVLNFGTFVCSNCAGIHREFNHKVKGLGVSNFLEKEVNLLQEMGNENARKIWIGGVSEVKYPDSKNPNDVKKFIRQKYIEKIYYAKPKLREHKFDNKNFKETSSSSEDETEKRQKKVQSVKSNRNEEIRREEINRNTEKKGLTPINIKNNSISSSQTNTIKNTPNVGINNRKNGDEIFSGVKNSNIEEIAAYNASKISNVDWGDIWGSSSSEKKHEKPSNQTQNNNPFNNQTQPQNNFFGNQTQNQTNSNFVNQTQNQKIDPFFNQPQIQQNTTKPKNEPNNQNVFAFDFVTSQTAPPQKNSSNKNLGNFNLNSPNLNNNGVPQNETRRDSTKNFNFMKKDDPLDKILETNFNPMPNYGMNNNLGQMNPMMMQQYMMQMQMQNQGFNPQMYQYMMQMQQMQMQQNQAPQQQNQFNNFSGIQQQTTFNPQVNQVFPQQNIGLTNQQGAQNLPNNTTFPQVNNTNSQQINPFDIPQSKNIYSNPDNLNIVNSIFDNDNNNPFA